MNCKSEHVKLNWNRSLPGTAELVIRYIEVNGLGTGFPGAEELVINLNSVDDAWPDLQHLTTTVSNGVYPSYMSVQGKIMDAMLWIPVMHELMRYVEVIELGLPLEPNE